MVKLTATKIVAAIKVAANASLAAKGAPVAIDLPGWEGYELSASKGRMYRIQQYKNTFVRVRNRHTKATAWSLTSSSQITACANECVRRGKETGWFGPTAVDYIPTTHPAFNM